MRKALFLMGVLLMGCSVYGQHSQKHAPSVGGGITAHTLSADTVTASGPTSFCQGGSVVLAGSPTHPNLQWSLNGSPIAGATSISINASVSGVYTLVSGTGAGAIHYDAVTVTVHPNPVATFTFNNDNTCSGTLIQFTSSTSSGTPPFTYSWDFGDGSALSTSVNPSHSFLALGCGNTTPFTVTLTVTDNHGCTSIITHVVTVKQKPDVGVSDQNVFSPFSNCDNNPTPSNPNFTVTINNNSPSSGCITSYTLDWGDGTIISNASFPLTHTYTQLGAFNLVVTGTSSVTGCSNSKTYVVANQSNPDIGIATFGPTIGCAPLPINIIVTTWQANSPGTIYWLNYGNGDSTLFTHPINSNNTNDTINYVYTTSPCPSSNVYQIKIRATNACKSKSFQGGDIEVRLKPQANFTLSQPSYCITQSVCPNNQTVLGYWSNCSTTTAWSWNFGDGFTSTQQSPCHTYAAVGTYTITLSATNPCGTSTFTKQVCIVATPTASFTLGTTTGCTPVTVSPVNNSSAIADCIPPTFLWSVSYTATNCGTAPASLPTSSATNPTFTFTNPGTYTITLTVTNSCGSISSSQNVVVKGPPSVSIPNIPSTCAPATINLPSSVTNCGSGTLTYSWSFPGGTPTSSTSATPSVVYNSSAGSPYTITLAATNECGTTTGTKTVAVNATPATPTAGSNTPVCSGQTLNLTSSTTTPGAITYSWTGPNGFSNSTQNPSIPLVTTAASGTYTVSASIGTCSTSVTTPVVINATPAAPTVANVAYCQNAAAVPLTATASAGATLLWYTAPSGGVGSATAPTPSTATVGTTTYYVSQVNTSSSCESVRSPIVVTVNAGPSLFTVTPTNPTSCASATGSISIGTLAAGTYTVTYIYAGNPVTLNGLSPNASGIIVIPNLASGTYSSITVTLNGCSRPASGPVTLSDPTPPQTPVATATAGPICSGGTLTLSATSGTGGVTFNWSGPNSFSATGTPQTISSVTTAASGTYSVTATLAGCSSAAGTVNVVISQTPVTPTVGANSPVCTGQTLTLTSNTATAGASYSWTGPNSFTNATQNPTIPSVTTAAAGSYVVTATLGTCSSNATTTVVVNQTPAITATKSDPTSCGSSTGTITISGLTNNIYTVNYTAGATPVILSNQVPNGSGVLTINNLPAGTYSNIIVTLAGCQSNVVGPFTLSDPTPPATPVATASTPVCTGQTLTLSAASTTPGVSFSWTGPAGFSQAGPNQSISSVTLANAGTYNVTASLSGCTSAAGNITVVVNQTPATPTITSNTPICSGQTLTLNASTITSGTMNYSWTGPNTFTSAVQNPTITNATSANSGTYNVTATLGSCTSAQGSAPIVVNTVPVISGSSSTNPTNCATATGTITLTGLNPSTSYAVSYSYNGGGTTTVNITSSASGNVVITNLVSGSYSNVTVTLANCPSLPVGPFSLSDPNPPTTPVATGSSPVCSGGTINLFSSAAPVGASYTWSGPGGFTNTVQNPVINNAAMTAGGTYSVTVTLNSCTSAAGTVNIVVNQTPAVPTAGSNTPVCSGSTLNLNANSSTAGVSYTWSGPNSFASSLQNPSITNVTTAAGGSYSVTATLGTCTSGAQTTNVVINATPVIGLVQISNPTNCATATGSLTINGLLNTTTYQVNYTQNGTPVSVSLASNGTGQVVISGLTSGVYNNIIVTVNNCPSAPAGPFTLSDPNPPATPVATTGGPVCTGSTLTFSATSATGPTVSYSWSGPNGFTSAIQAPSITGATMAANGVYSVTASLNGCTSAAGTVTGVVNLTPVVPTAGSNSPVCTTDTIALTAASSTPGVSYTWSGPASFSSTLQNPIIPNVTAANSGVYSVTATLGTCTSAAQTTTVLINVTPNIVSVLTSNPTSCASSTGTLTLTGLLPATNYAVSYLAGATPVNTIVASDAGGQVVITGLPAGTYSNITVALNNCPSLPVGPFVLSDPSPPAAPIVASNGPICENLTLTLNASGTPAGATFSWIGPNSFISAAQSPTISNASPAASGTYSVTATLNNCTSPAGTLNVVVNARPPAPNAQGLVIYCKNVTASPLSATALPGNTLNWYTVPVGGVASATAPTPSTTTPGGVTYYVSQTTPAGCEGPRAAIDIIVHPDADAHYTYIKDTACWPFNIAITNTSVAGTNSQYNWYANNVLISSTPYAFPGYTLTNPSTSTTIKMVAVSAFGCKPDSVQHTFYTRPKPVASFTASVTTGCGPLSVTFTNTTAVIDTFRYSWNFANGQTSTSTQPGTIIFQASPLTNDTIYVVTLKTFNECDTSIFQVNIAVSSKPRALFTPNMTVGCSPMHVVFTNNSLGSGASYTWSFGDGSPVVNTLLHDTISHTFYAGLQDTFYVKLHATNICGTDSAVYAIVVTPNTVHLFMAVNGPQQNGCAPHPVQFINNSSGANGFQWTFGDANVLSTTNNIDTVTHTYLTPGTYVVHLQGFNTCSDTTMNMVINVFAKPHAAFTANQYTACLGDSVQFTNQSDTTVTSYLWLFGDGNTSTQVNPTHTYATPGVYNVVLKVFRLNAPGNVCSDSTTIPVTIVSSIQGSFTASDTTSNCAPLTVTFTNQNVPATSATWIFGDGGTATGNTVTHTYTGAGTYIVQLTSHSPGGCTYNSTKTIHVYAPAGILQYVGGFVCGGHAVHFDATANNTDSFIWNFGDGIIQTTVTPSIYHTYANPGYYLPSVKLATIGGCQVLLQGIDTIKVDRIIKGFTESLNQSCGFTTVAFTDTSSAYFGKSLVKWNFGDGQTGTGVNVTHTYSSTGTYNVQLIVFSNSGCSDTLYKNVFVSVKTKPVVSIQSDTVLCANYQVPFTANVLSIDPIAFTEWSINGVPVANSNPYTASFTNPGPYSIRLIVGTVNNCYDTSYRTVVVNPSPTMAATNSNYICRGNSMQLNVTGATQIQWTPLQGLSCTTCPNPIANPLVTTPYVVQGTNSFGCSGWDTVIVTVVQRLQMSGVPSRDSICIGDIVHLNVSGASSYVWSPAGGLSSTTVPNPIANTPTTVTYRVIGYDGYNCFTDTGYALIAVGQYPTVNLIPDQVLSTGTLLPLNTNVTNGPIRDWLWTPATSLSCSDCPLPIAEIKTDITYGVTVTNYYGCSASDTIRIKAFCEGTQVFLPNTFTPDGDGVNDIFMVQGKGIGSVKTFRVFNRWGELVFERNHFTPNDPSNGWDGRVRGVPASPDVFVWTAEVLCENGNSYVYKGNVTLLK